MNVRMLIASIVGIMIRMRRTMNVSIAPLPRRVPTLACRAKTLAAYPGAGASLLYQVGSASFPFEPDARRLVDAAEKYRRVGEIFVGGFSRSFIGAVIVDNQGALPRQSRIEMDQLVAGRAIPIGVQPEQ